MIDGSGHASAHEQLLDLALEPDGLEALSRQIATGGAPGSELAGHVAGCPVCRSDLATWRRTHAAVHEAIAGPDGDGPASTHWSPGSSWRRIGAAFRQRSRVSALLVAGLAIVLVGSGALFLQAQALDRARADTVALQGLTATLDRVISDPSHRVVALRAADGNVAGSISWSSHDIVVLTTALEPPPAGRVYRCWIERAGERSPVGMMWFAGSTAFWSGSIDTWAATSFDAGGTFGVSLEPASGAGAAAGSAVLAADLTAPYAR
jgi:hypothetical protein